MNTTIKLRRDTAANWSNVNPILAEAELGVELDTSKVKLGDGATAWNDLSYSIGEEEIPTENRPELIWEWEVTTTQSNTLDLPLDGLYTCTVDWGDGSALESVTDITKPSHVYSSPGKYKVTVEGDLDEVGWDAGYYAYTDLSFNYNSGGNPHSNGILKSILSWGDYMRTQLDNETNQYKYSFKENKDIEYIAKFSVRNRTTLAEFFSECQSLKEIPKLENTGNITNLYKTFKGCHSLTTLTGLEDWDVSNVTTVSNTFNSTFSDCVSLRDILALRDWDISNFSSINYLFYNCKSLTTLTGLENWDVSNLTTLEGVFIDCQSLVNIYSLESWDVSNKISLDSLFVNCENLIDFTGLSSWDVSNVQTMVSTFANTGLVDYYSSGFQNWSTPSLTSINGIFRGCKNLIRKRRILGWDLSSLSNCSYAFSDCYSLQDVNIFTNLSSVTQDCNFKNMFENCWSITSIEDFPFLPSTFSINSNIENMFFNCKNLNMATGLSSWVNPGSDQDFFKDVFKYCSSLRSLNISWYTGYNFNNSTSTNTYTYDEFEGTDLRKSTIVDLFNTLGTIPSGAGDRNLSLKNVISTQDLSPTEIQILTDKGWTLLT